MIEILQEVIYGARKEDISLTINCIGYYFNSEPSLFHKESIFELFSGHKFKMSDRIQREISLEKTNVLFEINFYDLQTTQIRDIHGDCLVIVFSLNDEETLNVFKSYQYDLCGRKSVFCVGVLFDEETRSITEDVAWEFADDIESEYLEISHQNLENVLEQIYWSYYSSNFPPVVEFLLFLSRLRNQSLVLLLVVCAIFFVLCR